MNIIKRKRTQREYNQTVLEAKRLIVAGKGYEAASEILGVSTRYVKKLAQIGLLPRSKRPGFCKKGKLTTPEFNKMVKEGRSTYSIAKHFNVTEAAVRKKRLGVDFSLDCG